jgi:hypothetical protein
MFNPQQAQPSTGTGGSNAAQQATPQSGSSGTTPDAGTAQGLHPVQRDRPATATEEQQAEQQKNEPDPTRSSSGGNLPGDSTNTGGDTAASGGSKAGGSVLALTTDEKEKIRRVIRSYSIAPPERANFPLRLGAAVPANVDLKPLPPEVASIVPDYKNYSYVLTQGQIAIVITDKREIDLLIPG